MGTLSWDTSTWVSVFSAGVTIFAVILFLGFEWYRRPRLHVRPSQDQSDSEWIHLTVVARQPWRWFLPRDLAVDCTARVSFLDPVSKNELMPQIQAHWAGASEPQHYWDIQQITKRNIGFWEEPMIDVLRRLNDGTTYAAHPLHVYRSWPSEAIPQDPVELERHKLKQREYCVRVELFAGNGWRTTQEFRLTLPVGLGEVKWESFDP
jgi:hypothetical protein